MISQYDITPCNELGEVESINKANKIHKIGLELTCNLERPWSYSEELNIRKYVRTNQQIFQSCDRALGIL